MKRTSLQGGWDRATMKHCSICDDDTGAIANGGKNVGWVGLR